MNNAPVIAVLLCYFGLMLAIAVFMPALWGRGLAWLGGVGLLMLIDGAVGPRLRSFRYRVDALFREHGVTIPFPQRDVHFYPHQPLTILGGESKDPLQEGNA